MSTAPENVARCYAPPGTLWQLARNRDITTGAGRLIAQDLSIITDRPALARQWDLVAGWPVDHGAVANEAAMLALHTFDQDAATQLAPRYIAPGDSCTRADDPGWRWVCLSGHGTTLAQWERRPLESTINGKQPLSAELTALAALSSTAFGRNLLTLANSAALLTAAGAQAALANASALGNITESAGNQPLWRGGAWPSSSSLGAYAVVRHATGGQSLSATAWTYLTWTATAVDTGDYWSSSNPTRLTAPVTGMYIIDAAFQRIASNSNSMCAVVVNRTKFSSTGNRANYTDLRDHISALVYMSAGDYAEVAAYSESATTVKAPESWNNWPEVRIARVG